MTFLSGSVLGAVLSISDATIKSNYQGFSKAWVVSMVSDDYTTDSLTAYLTPQDFQDASGTASKQSLNINVHTKPNYCTYSFKTNSFSYQEVYTVQPIHIQRFWKTDFINDVVAQCTDYSTSDMKVHLDSSGNPTGSYVWYKTGLIYYDAWCVKLNEKLGTVAQPIDKTIVAQSDWSVTAQGKTPQTATLSNSDAGDGRSTKLGDNVWVQWQGNLGTGQDCPDVSNLIGIHSNSNPQGWKFASRSAYTTYADYLTTGIRSDIAYFGQGQLTDSQFSSRANGIINNVNVEKKDFTYSVLDTSVSSGKVKIDLGSQIVFPLFRLIINAQYLEINIPTGKPQIVSTQDIKFAEGLAGQENVVIKNIGTDKGGFTTRVINCEGGFSSSTSPIGSTLDAGQSATLTFNVIGSTTSEQATVTGKCTVEMKESITGEVATKDFGITMEQIPECTPETYACSVDPATGNQAIKKCNTAGTKYEIIEVCQQGFDCKLTADGKANCVDPEYCKTHPEDPKCGGGSCTGHWYLLWLDGLWCKITSWFNSIVAWFQGWTMTIRIVMAVIVGFLGGLLGTSFISKHTKDLAVKKKWIIYLISFAVLGGLLGFLAYVYFWWIVLALIILGIIKALVPFL